MAFEVEGAGWGAGAGDGGFTGTVYRLGRIAQSHTGHQEVSR
jgi:hypothetical protein